MLDVLLQKKVAFIGFGEHAIRGHYKHLIHLCTVVGFSDPKVELDYLPALAEEHKVPMDGLRKYINEHEVFADKDISAVFICSLDHQHLSQMKDALTAGKHVFCEKPMFVNYGEAELFTTLLSFAEQEGLHVSTCHPRRFDPPIMWLNRNLHHVDEKLGGISTFEFIFKYHEVTDAWKMDRSLLSDHFSHEIDLFAFLFGDKPFEAKKILDGYNAYKVTGKAENGIDFIFDGTRYEKEHVYHEWIKLHGPRGSMTLFLNTGEVKYSNGETEQTPDKNYDGMFLAVNKDFIDGIEKNTPLYLTHNDLHRNNITAAQLKDQGEVVWHPH